MHIEKIVDKTQKSEITKDILHMLPDWFGIESALLEYAKGAEDSDFYAAWDMGEPIGFISLISHNVHTSEIYVMGIKKEFHGCGIGKLLVRTAEEELAKSNRMYLMVKTLGPSHPDENYGRTRKFYESAGFVPLEEIKEIWGAENPCLIMVKNLVGKEAFL